MADAKATGQAFRAAVESWDIDAARELLAPDIVFHSPVTFHPFVGRETVGDLLAIVAKTFENFRYIDELAGEGTHELVFRAEVGGRELEGIDLLRIADFTVMIRPLSGLVPFAQRMGEQVQAAGLATAR
jgi:hypothetical protein